MKAGIAGAGLMGRLLAWRLAKMGWEITLFDKGDRAGCSSAAYAAAGMLSPLSEMENAELEVLRFGNYGLKRWPEWLSELKRSVYFQQMGSLVLAHPHDYSELIRFGQQLSRKLSVRSLDGGNCSLGAATLRGVTQEFLDFAGAPSRLRIRTADAFIEDVTKEQLRELEPELTFEHGYFLPQEGQIDGRSLLVALADELDSHGVDWHFNSNVEKVGSHFIESDRRYTFDWVFDCRGGGAGDVFSDLRHVRGELIHLYAPEVHIHRPIRLLHPRYRIYIVPRPEQRYLLGASEIESNDVSPISVRTCLELLSAAYSVHAGFAEARIIETVTGTRPALNDNLPRTLFSQGFTAVNGLYRHGFLLAPALVDEVVERINVGWAEL